MEEKAVDKSLLPERNKIGEFEALPLTYVYEFFAQKGLKNEADQIKHSKDKFLSYNSTLRRGKVIKLLEEKGFFEEFIDGYWHFGRTDRGKRKIALYKKIYDRWRRQTGEEMGMDEEESVEETIDVLESELRDLLSKNLSLVEPGLQLYTNEKGADGVEYLVDEEGRRVDILAKDKNGVPVIIELKVSRGYEKVIGQCLYYRARVKQLLRSQKARIIIIAREITSQLKAATQDLSDIDLFEYRLSIKVDKIIS